MSGTEHIVSKQQALSNLANNNTTEDMSPVVIAVL
jgi:hypothetical protein